MIGDSDRTVAIDRSASDQFHWRQRTVGMVSVGVKVNDSGANLLHHACSFACDGCSAMLIAGAGQRCSSARCGSLASTKAMSSAPDAIQHVIDRRQFVSNEHDQWEHGPRGDSRSQGRQSIERILSRMKDHDRSQRAEQPHRLPRRHLEAGPETPHLRSSFVGEGDYDAAHQHAQRPDLTRCVDDDAGSVVSDDLHADG